LPAGFWIASAAGVASLASFGVFAVLGHNSQTALGSVPGLRLVRRNDYDKMRRNYLMADLSLGAAALSAGIATWLFFLRKLRQHGRAQAGRRRDRAAVCRGSTLGGSGAALFVNAGGF